MRNIFSYVFASLMLVTVITGACTDDDIKINDTPILSKDAISIGAKVEEALSTRTYIESGQVKAGKFLLTYPYYYSGQDAYGYYRYLFHYGDVTFGYQGQETTGFVNVGTPLAPKELVWSPTNAGTSSDDGIFVWPANTPSPLVLDNFMCKAVLNTSNLVDSIVNITEKYPENPYKAGIFDAENGTNDLLWGKELVKGGTDVINFNLSHRMTRLILNVIVEPDNSPQPDTQTLTINLDNASVTLTDILLDPVSYRRLYGELLFQNRLSNVNDAVSSTISVDYKDFRLVRSEASDDRDTEDENGNLYQWAKVEDNAGNKTYTTQDFVFVPQTLRQGTSLRPRIIIAVPQKDVNEGHNPGYELQDSIYFSGNIPVTMKMDNGDDIPPSLQTLNFDPGKVITLTTKMKPGEMELEFAPVTVEPWVYKGTFYPSAKQSGIYTAEDLYSLIEYYKAGNEYWLHKFGYIENPDSPNEQWRFMINSGSLEFEVAQIIGKMIPGQPLSDGELTETPKFTFDFRSRDQYYIMPDGTKVTMGTYSQNLVDIVKASANSGVKQTGDNETINNFNDLITAYQKNFWQQFIYGTYDDTQKQWTFRITEDISLDYKKIAAQMMPPDYTRPNFKFNIEPGVTVTITNYPDAVETTKVVTAEELYTIVSDRIPGLYSASDFTKLLNAIKGGETGAMNQFGNQEPGGWTFPLQRDITISGAALQGFMNGIDLSSYGFENNGYNLTLSQYDGSNVLNPSFEDLKTILGLEVPTGISGAQIFYDLIEAYNNPLSSLDQLSKYGYYCISPSRWVFVFTEAMTLDKSIIEGSMIPDDSGKLPFTFNLNYKQIKFEGESGDGITGQNGAETLLNIVTTPKP